MERVVIYTPAQDFFYNDPTGATLVVYFFFLLISALVGFFVSMPFRRDTTTQTFVGVVAGIICFLTLFWSLKHF